MSPKKLLSAVPSRRRSSGRRGARAAAKRALKPVVGPAPTGRDPAAIIRVGSGKDGVVARIPMSANLTRMAAEWMYILRNRSRWACDEDMRQDMSDRALDALKKLGLGEDALRSRVVAADSRQLEVEFPEGDGKSGRISDAASAFPWEFLLSVATRNVGRSRALLITRTLARKKAPATGAGDPLFLESAPGRLRDTYSFESERLRLNAAMAHNWKVMSSPTLDKLARRNASNHPRIVHVSAIDNHQVSQFLDGFYENAIPEDGIVMQGERGSEVPVPYTDFAQNLVGAKPPQLVTLNCYYSATRIARECVSRGAHAALGFFDEVDDELAEIFFQTFYWAWRERGSTVDSLPRAFGRTWNVLKDQGLNLYGTGIVLWLARSVFEASRHSAFIPTEEGPEDKLVSRLPTKQELAQSRAKPINDVLQVDLNIPKEINYSLLHNSRRFLNSLTLTKLVEHALDEVKVEVQLNAGDNSLPYRYTEAIFNQPQLALADKVKIPLTASLLRAPRERVQTTLYVRVTWDNRIAREETESVTLLPVDEWFDDTQKNPWLPSFVLPRDPAVARIVTAARRHLVTLQDDPVAGFDGYQSTEVTNDIKNDDCDSVDEQVRALWTALVQEFRLAYINPPPAYSQRNQRLRTPSEVLSSSSGTCIDLSLLLASCLEYVDIYPVVVLLSGHAFVGYWRADEYHEEFCRCGSVPAVGIDVGQFSAKSMVSLVDPYAWRVAQQQYLEILEYLRAGKIRFLEATGLCFNYSYAEAVDEGRGDLKVPEDFDSMLDITLARRATPPVTPLPMILAGREV